jgi:hypothetical protein
MLGTILKHPKKPESIAVIPFAVARVAIDSGMVAVLSPPAGQILFHEHFISWAKQSPARTYTHGHLVLIQ